MIAYHIVKATIHAQHSVTGMRVEVGIECDNVGAIAQCANDMSNNGFRAIVVSAKQDNVNAIGTVESVSKKPDGKNGFDVVIKLDKGGEQKLTAFKATEYRKGDRVKLTKNDKGFYEGVLVTDDDEASTNTTTDIPF